MAKVKRRYKVLTTIVVILLVIVGSGYGVFRSAYIQTKLTHWIMDELSEKLGTEVRITGVDLTVTSKLVLEGVLVRDLDQDTLLYTSQLKVGIDYLNIQENSVALNYLGLNTPYVNLYTKEKNGDYNYQFIVDSLSGQESNDTASNTFKVDLNKLELNNARFRLLQFESQLIEVKTKQLVISIDDFLLNESKLNLSEVRIKQPDFLLQTLDDDSNPDAEHITEIGDRINFCPIQIQSKTLSINDGSVHLMFDSNSQLNKRHFDHNNMFLKKVNLSFEDIIVCDDSIQADIQSISCIESNTFKLHNFSGKALISNNSISIKNLSILTAGSNVNCNASLRFKSFEDFSNFNGNVNLEVKLNPSSFLVRDANYFSTGINHFLNEKISIEGLFKGTLNDFKLTDFAVKTQYNGFAEGSVYIKKDQYFSTPFLDVNLSDFLLTHNDLQKIVSEHVLPNKYLNLGSINSNVRITGFLDDFVVYGQIGSGIGSIRTDIKLHENEKGNYTYDGICFADSINIGKLIENELVGIATLFGHVKGSGFSIEDLNANFDGEVKSVELNQYTYKNIKVNGLFKEKFFNGLILAKDENVDLIFKGNIDLNQVVPKYNFLCELHHANLKQLNLTERTFNTSFYMNADFHGNRLDDLIGSINLNNITISNILNKKISLNEFEFTSYIQDGYRYLRLNSDIADGYVNGRFSWKNLPEIPNKLINRFFIESDEVHEDYHLNLEFDLTFKENKGLYDMVSPNYRIGSDSYIKGNYLRNGAINLDVNIVDLHLQQIQLENLKTSITNQSDSLIVSSSVDRFYLTDSFAIDGIEINSDIYYHTASTSFNLGTKHPSNSLRSLIKTTFNHDSLFLDIEKSDLTVDNQKWIVESDDIIISNTTFFTSGIDLHNLSNNSSINLKGKATDKINDKLEFKFKNINIHDWWLLLGQQDIILGGLLNGTGNVFGVLEQPRINSDISIDNLSINDDVLGNVSSFTSYSAADAILRLGISVSDEQKTLLDFGGKLNFEEDNNNYQLELNIDELNLANAQPFVQSQISNLTGSITTKENISITGAFNDPQINGLVKINRGEFKLNYLGVNYIFDNDIRIADNVISLESMPLFAVDTIREKGRIKDIHFNQARIKGYITSSMSEGINYSFQIAPEPNFPVLNTTVKDNELYYGKVRLGKHSDIDLNGTLSQPNINLSLNVGKNCELFVPITDEEDLSDRNFIQFINNNNAEDTTVLDHKEDLEIGLNCDLKINDSATTVIQLGIPDGDIIKANGSGDIRLVLQPGGEFSIYGKYMITKGKYTFSLEDLLTKELSVEENSNITWNGDSYNAILDLDAVLSIKTSVDPLTSLLSATEAEELTNLKRIPVECHLLLTGSLMKPDINFKLVYPENESANATVESVFSRINNDPQMLNQQVFSLLILNSFTPLTAASGSRNAGIGAGVLNQLKLTKTVSSFLSSYLNLILQQTNVKFFQDLDLALNYEVSDNNSLGEIQLELSKSFFNNRVVFEVDGSFVLGGATANQNMTGDFSMEYLMTKDGRLRGKVFNSIYNDVLLGRNRNLTGVGLSYRKDFDYIHELWRRKHQEVN